MKGMIEIVFVRARGEYQVWCWVNNFDCLRKGTRKSLGAARNLANRLGTIYKETAI